VINYFDSDPRWGYFNVTVDRGASREKLRSSVSLNNFEFLTPDGRYLYVYGKI